MKEPARTRRVLVTGGAGFIGSAVIAELCRRGAHVAAVDNLSFGRWENLDLPAGQRLEIDIRDRAELIRAVTAFAPDWILHLAALHFIPYCNANPVETVQVNIGGTLNVIDAALEVEGLQGFLFASTAAVYPVQDGAVAEDHPADPSDIYGLSKQAGERLCSELHLRRQLPVVLCRFFNAFGPNETNAHLIPEIERQLLEGQRTLRLGNLEPQRDFIHTSDMARAVCGLTEKVTTGLEVFNVGSGREYSVRSIVAAFERHLGEPITIEQDPTRMRPVERMHLLADSSKLQSFLGWRPQVGLDEGIALLLSARRTT